MDGYVANRRAARAACLGLVLLSRSSLAVAEPSPARALAHDHFERGVTLTRQHAYAEAVSEFQAAYDASPHFSVLYNIGQAQAALGRHADAVRTLQRYLDDGGAHIDAQRRTEVTAIIEREAAYTGVLEVVVDVAGALVSVDTVAYGRSPLEQPMRVDPGTHTITAALDSGERRELTLEVFAQEQRRVELGFAAAAPPASTASDSQPTSAAMAPRSSEPAAPAPSTPLGSPPSPATPRGPAHAEPSSGASQRTLAYVIGGVGVALSGAALAHFLWNRGRYQDWKDAYADYSREPSEGKRVQANQLADSIDRASRVTVGLALGAGLALGTGSVLIITSEGDVSARAGRQGLRPWVSWRGRF